MTNLSKDVYNKLLAKLVLNHRMVDRERLQTCWREVSPEKDLGQIMIEYNVIDFPPAYIPPNVTEAMNWMKSAALMQLVQSGTITRREAMERMETK